MRIVELAQNEVLAGTKKTMLISCLGFASCLILCGLFSALGGALASPAFFIAAGFMAFVCFIFWIVGLVGLYQFSQFCKTFVFRFYIYDLLIKILFIVIILAVPFTLSFIIAKTTDLTLEFISDTAALWFFGVVDKFSIAYVILHIYLTYKMSKEMRRLTGCGEFMAAFKLYVAFILVSFIVSIVNFTAISGSESDWIWIYRIILGILAFVVLCISIAYNVLLILGVYNIRSVCLLDSTPCVQPDSETKQQENLQNLESKNILDSERATESKPLNPEKL